MAVTLPPSGDAPGEVRRTVESVLSRPEFGSSEPSLVDRALAWLSEQFARFIGLVVGNDVGQTVFSAVLALAALAVVVAALVYARRLRRDRTVEAAAIVASGGVSAAEWAARALRAADAGDLREAVRCRYRALVADLAERGVVDEIPGRTAGQYLDAVRTAVPSAAEPFGRATAVFERAWYGHTVVTDADDAAMTDAVADTGERISAHTGGRDGTAGGADQGADDQGAADHGARVGSLP